MKNLKKFGSLFVRLLSLFWTSSLDSVFPHFLNLLHLFSVERLLNRCNMVKKTLTDERFVQVRWYESANVASQVGWLSYDMEIGVFSMQQFPKSFSVLDKISAYIYLLNMARKVIHFNTH